MVLSTSFSPRSDPHPSPATSFKAFLLVDAAQSFDMRLRMEGLGLEHRCLLNGMENSDRAGTLPYLVPIERFGSASEWFRNEVYGRNWGILISTLLDIDPLVRDLKKFVRCNYLDEQNAFFRFYRPETFHAFARALELRDQAALLRGKHIYAEAPGNDEMTRFTIVDGELEALRFQLDHVMDTLLHDREA